MKIKLTAPDGYKLKDVRNDRTYSEVVTDEKNRKFFELVPDETEQTININI